MSGYPALIQSDDPNEVSIQLGGTLFKGWQSVAITRSCETLPPTFQVSASTEFMQGDAMAATRPGKPCTVSIGKDLVITGWLDRRTINTSPDQHVVTLIGRGITRNLVDCSADILKDPALFGGMIEANNTLDVANRLCKSFNITARSAVADLGVPILKFQIAIGETPYQIIESVARYAGYLVYEDTNGNLVLDRVGTTAHATGFTQPGNIEALSAMQAEDGKYSDYMVVWNAINQLQQINDLGNNRLKQPVHDNTVPEYRPLIRVSAQLTPAYDIGVAMANWEWARRLGRSQAAMITCDSWRDGPDKDGKLWTPNMLAPINAPANDIANGQWIIGSVTYRKDMTGTHADLVLMPPMAFEVQPNPLNLWDLQIAATTPPSQSPAPPTTDPTKAPPWLPGPTP